jgi:hypothetical protein
LSKKRAIALVAAAAAVFPLVFAAPSLAVDSPASCQTLVQGPTPSVEVDTNNDGNPEVRVPSLRDARLCVTGDVTLSDSPSWWSEPCNWQGTCQRFFIHYGLSGQAEAYAQLCYYLDGFQTCTNMRPIRVPINPIQGGTMCIGVDATGGRPCANGTALIAFE